MQSLYHSFPLNCYELLRDATLEYMGPLNQKNIYVENLPITQALREIFNQEMISYGLTPARNFLCFKRKHYYSIKQSVHIDFDRSIDEKVKCSIVIPVDGCKDTSMYWIDGKYDTSYQSINGSSYLKIEWLDNNQSTLDKVEIYNQPMLTKVDTPHGVTSRLDGEYRTVLSIRLIGNPSFEHIINTRFNKLA